MSQEANKNRQKYIVQRMLRSLWIKQKEEIEEKIKYLKEEIAPNG